jgi:hypothetical protein
MTKPDLAYVLVKYSGFGYLLMALNNAVTHATYSFGSALEHKQRFSYAYGSALTSLAEIALALLVIRYARPIAKWLVRDDKT